MNRLYELKEELEEHKRIIKELEEEIKEEEGEEYDKLKDFLSHNFTNYVDFHKYAYYIKELEMCDDYALWAFYRKFPEIWNNAKSFNEIGDKYAIHYEGCYESEQEFLEQLLLNDFCDNIEDLFEYIDFKKLHKKYYNNYVIVDNTYVFNL